MKQQAITLGHDVEFFVRKINGEVVPVCGLVGGTKDKPLPLPGSKVGTIYQEDGAAVELGMSPIKGDSPSELTEEFLQAFKINYSEVSGLLSERGLEITGYQDFSFATLPREAMEIGCSPDNDAWMNGATRYALDAGAFLQPDGSHLRCTAGHIHFGFTQSEVPNYVLVQMLDILVLGRSAQFQQSLDGKRIKFYGRPGLFRNKPYGLEYRSPCNLWATESARGSPGGESSLLLTRAASVVKGCTTKPLSTVKKLYRKLPLDDFDRAWRTGKEGYNQWLPVMESDLHNLYQELTA